ncbi:unnamed protein product [Brassica oleracea]
MPSCEIEDHPYSLKATQECPVDQDVWTLGPWKDTIIPTEETTFRSMLQAAVNWKNLPPWGVIGMDAQVVYGFHNLRNEKPYLANGRPYISPMKLYILATVGLMASSWCIAQTTLVQGLYKHQQNICYNLNVI